RAPCRPPSTETYPSPDSERSTPAASTPRLSPRSLRRVTAPIAPPAPAPAPHKRPRWTLPPPDLRFSTPSRLRPPRRRTPPPPGRAYAGAARDTARCVYTYQ